MSAVLSMRWLRRRGDQQALIGVGVILLAGGVGAGAWAIPSFAGYAGVGPDFLPWLVAGVLLLCGGLLVWHARQGGYRDFEEPSGASAGDWRAFAWVAAGLLAVAALIKPLGFVAACALCFALAVRGLRQAEGKPAGALRQALVDGATGLAIAAPVYWLFRFLLGINLPALTAGGVI